MQIEIVNDRLELTIYGYSGIALNKDYSGTAFGLSRKMWEVVKKYDIKNKGKNIWIYEQHESVFAGVELENIDDTETPLERKKIVLTKYGYYKHIGSWKLIKQVGTEMTSALRSKGYETTLPYIEIYGHWTPEESACESELFMQLL